MVDEHSHDRRLKRVTTLALIGREIKIIDVTNHQCRSCARAKSLLVVRQECCGRKRRGNSEGAWGLISVDDASE